MRKKQHCIRKISVSTILIDNIPTVILWIFGLFFLFNIHWIFFLAYLFYIPFSVLWFWRYICTYCDHYDTGCCPCGYGKAAPKLFLFRDPSKFKQAFNRNIAVVFPYWLVILIAGGYLLLYNYSQMFLIIFIIACIDGFIIIPLISKLVGCNQCPSKENCPWAAGGKEPKRHF